MLKRWNVLLLVAAVSASFGLSLRASAADAKNDKKKDEAPNLDDLFGPSPQKGSGLEEMKKATDSMGQASTSSGLAPKVAGTDDSAVAVLHGAFAADHVVQDKKLGCMPAGKDKKKISEWHFDDLPAKTKQTFEVCLSVSSKSGREMSLSAAIVDAKNQRIARAEGIIDFRGRERVDHVMQIPAPTFRTAGQYLYVVELDGNEAGRLPLFVVKLDASAVEAPRPPGLSAPDSAPTPDGK